MIAESINFVERKLESILREAGTKILDEDKAPIFEKYLRLWQLVVRSPAHSPSLPPPLLAHTLGVQTLARTN